LFGYVAREVVTLAKEIDAKLGEIVGWVQKWSGRVFIKHRADLPDAFGEKLWSCDIGLRVDCSPGTLVHELLHGRSLITPQSYTTFKPLEEGVVEMLTRLVGNDVLPDGLEIGSRVS